MNMRSLEFAHRLDRGHELIVAGIRRLITYKIATPVYVIIVLNDGSVWRWTRDERLNPEQLATGFTTVGEGF